MSAIRRAGFAMSYGELDDGLAGVAAPIFGIDGVVIGSIVAALTQQRLALIQIDKLTDAIKAGATRISEEVAIISDPARHIDETQGAET